MLRQIKIILPTLLCLTAFAVVSGQFLHHLGEDISRSVEESLKPLENLGDRIEQDVRRQLSGLEHLGVDIEREVNKGLEPLRILESITKVKSGEDGVTVATYYPSGQKLVIRNGVHYTCDGTIDESSGRCSGDTYPLQYQNKQDFCFVSNRNIINEWYCIIPGGNSKTISYINGRIVCRANGNSPSLLVKRQEFNDFCRSMAETATFKYFTNTPLQHVGDGLVCSRQGANQVCTFKESMDDTSHGGSMATIQSNFQSVYIP